jgi:hypothetical protein
MEQVRKRGLPPLLCVRVILIQRNRYCDYILAVHSTCTRLFTSVVVLAFQLDKSKSIRPTHTCSTAPLVVARGS